MGSPEAGGRGGGRPGCGDCTNAWPGSRAAAGRRAGAGSRPAIASAMFPRRPQKSFFRCMRREFGFDRLSARALASPDP